VSGAFHSPSSILRRVAYPVEPFDLKLVLRELPPPSLMGEHDSFRQQPSLFEKLSDHPEDYFKYIHKVGFLRVPGHSSLRVGLEEAAGGACKAVHVHFHSAPVVGIVFGRFQGHVAALEKLHQVLVEAVHALIH
jgi:hypothetical protein